MAKFIFLLSVCVIFAAKCESRAPLSTNAEITKVSKRLFESADLRLCSKVKINQKTPLLDISDSDLNSVSTVRTFRDLFDLFEMDTRVAETTNAVKERKIDAFLEAVLATQVIQDLMNFFKSKQINAVKGGKDKQKKFLKERWFGTYARNKAGPKSSNGMEHVFFHEMIYKDGRPELSGGHNWIYFHYEEMKKTPHAVLVRINKSLGLYSKNAKLRLLNIVQRFDQLDPKPSTTMFTCITPEYELALYTLCIEMCMDPCIVTIGDKQIIIKWFTFDQGISRFVASSYPDARG